MAMFSKWVPIRCRFGFHDIDRDTTYIKEKTRWARGRRQTYKKIRYYKCTRCGKYFVASVCDRNEKLNSGTRRL